MATVNLTTNDYASQLAAIARRQKYAELLAKQGAEDIDVQSVGGIPTPISPFQGLAKVLKSGMGAYLGRKAGEDEAEATAAEKKAVNEERARIFGMTPAVAATYDQGAYEGVDAEGIPSYAVNLTTPAKAASYTLRPEEQINALNVLSGRSKFGEQAATMGMPLAVRGLERADAQTDLAAKQAYDAGIRGEARTQELKDKTQRPLTPKEIADRGLRLGTSASIDGFGNVTIDQPVDTLSPEALRQRLLLAAAGRASRAGDRPPSQAFLRLEADDLKDVQLAGSIASDLDSYAKKIDTGKMTLGLAANLGSRAGLTLGMANQNAREIGSFRATLAKLRNDTLRLNKGTQTEGDAVRAFDELFQNINDQGFVRKRLDEIKQINTRAQAQRITAINDRRELSGYDPIDESKYLTQPSAYESPAAQNTGGAGGVTPAAAAAELARRNAAKGQ